MKEIKIETRGIYKGIRTLREKVLLLLQYYFWAIFNVRIEIFL